MAQELDVVRHELRRRIAALDGRARHARPHELATAVDEIRVIAYQAGLFPAVTVTQFVAAALARGERGALVRGCLPVLRDAIGAERQDSAACNAFAAACSVRFEA